MELFIAGQIIALIVAVIGWYISHIRLRDKVAAMEKDCKECRDATLGRFQDVRKEINLDIEEIKIDVKELKRDLQKMQINVTGQFAEIKTLISGRTVQL
jgi:hypothetical protein